MRASTCQQSLVNKAESHLAVSAEKLHGRGGIVHLALQSTGQKPNDRHVILVTHEDSGVAVWNFRCPCMCSDRVSAHANANQSSRKAEQSI